MDVIRYIIQAAWAWRTAMDQHIGADASRQLKKRRPGLTFAELPLFASDDELGVALLGRARSALWHSLVTFFEQQGLPKNDPHMGGRYVPAVKAFFDRQYGLTAVPTRNSHR
jgi:hypothetical protein